MKWDQDGARGGNSQLKREMNMKTQNETCREVRARLREEGRDRKKALEQLFFENI